MADDITVDKDKFDAVLQKIASSKPLPFKDVVAKPKPKRGGGAKRSAKRAKPTPPE